MREARKSVARAERSLAQLTAREEQLHDEMVAAATDAQEMLRLSRELEQLHTQREGLEHDWLAAAELADP
jgi:ATP-binding cassette subfamily F protein uup